MHWLVTEEKQNQVPNARPGARTYPVSKNDPRNIRSAALFLSGFVWFRGSLEPG